MYINTPSDALKVLVAAIVFLTIVATCTLGLTLAGALFITALYIGIVFVCRYFGLRFISTIVAACFAIYLGGRLVSGNDFALVHFITHLVSRIWHVSQTKYLVAIYFALCLIMLHALNIAIDILCLAWFGKRAKPMHKKIEVLTMFACYFVVVGLVISNDRLVYRPSDSRQVASNPSGLLRFEVKDPLQLVLEMLPQRQPRRQQPNPWQRGQQQGWQQPRGPQQPALEPGTPNTPYPAAWTQQLKEFENYPLARGNINVSGKRPDSFSPAIKEVGYGITAHELEDARAVGVPVPAQLPTSLTKHEADKWLAEVTIPTYRAHVRREVRIPLSLNEEFALVSFAHNLGVGNLRKLVNGKDRINSGRQYKQATAAMIPAYDNAANGTENVPGLIRRRAWEKRLFEAEPTSVARR